MLSIIQYIDSNNFHIIDDNLNEIAYICVLKEQRFHIKLMLENKWLDEVEIEPYYSTDTIQMKAIDAICDYYKKKISKYEDICKELDNLWLQIDKE